jgi:glutathione S-transferase
MKFLDFALAPNPKKVRVYMAEKKLDIPIEQVDVMGGKNRTAEFLGTVNPMGGLPVLQLDDGSHLTESLAIMEYLEDLHPNPPMLGGTPLERAHVRETERICDLGVLLSVGTYFQNTSPFFAGRVKQQPDTAQMGKDRANTAAKVLDHKLGKNKFLCGDKPTIADCTLFAALEFSNFAGYVIDLAPLPNLSRWSDAFKQRPSASA